jgi:hypothetical protein
MNTSHEIHGSDPSLPWEPANLEIVSNFEKEILAANIRANARRDLPFMIEQSFAKTDEPLAIVAGGPTLNDTIGDLRQFRHVMVCGSAHDHVVSLGIKPTYATFCDAMPSPPFFSQKQKDCHYLLATQCDPSLFDHLSDCLISMWDLNGYVAASEFEGRGRINGGTTMAMRAPAIGLVLGYSDFHFFGVDSSFPNERDRHAYDYEDESEILPVVHVRINDRVFRTTNQFIAQAQDFQSICTHYGTMFSVKVYGDSLMGAVWKDMNDKVLALFKRESN